MLHGGTTIPGTVLALFVPIWSHVKRHLLDTSHLPIQKNLPYVCQTGAENMILITFFKIFPTQSMQYTNTCQGSTNLLLLHGPWEWWLKKKIWARMLHQRAIWGWSVRLAEQSHLTARASLFVMFYSSDDLFDASCKIKILVCAKSPK